MKKKYAISLALLFAGGTLLAQSTQTEAPARKMKADHDQRHDYPDPGNEHRGADIWCNTFANPADWNIAQEPGAFPGVNWQIGVGLVNTGGYTTPAIQSTTAADGYAMVDSDAGNNSGTTYESCHFTNATPIDLSLYPNVILQFENQYRKFTDEQCYVVISTNNTDWPTNLDPTTDISGMPNVFYVWQPDGELTQGVSPGNPTTKRINISAAAGGQSTVWIRFWWTGIWGYSWFVDDVCVQEQAQFDLSMNDAFLVHTPGTGLEYGRIPVGQLGTDMEIGGRVFNLGVQGQNNLVVNGDITGPASFSASTNAAFLAPDDTLSMDEMTALPTMGTGVYNGTFTVTSDESGSDGFPDNNTYLRNFEVTDYVYSLDGIGNHPPGYEFLTSTGTATFTNETDGLFLFTMYPIAADLTVYGIEVQFANGTVAGGTINAQIHDTASIAPFGAVGADPYSPYVLSDDETVTAADVSAGKKLLVFPAPYTLTPGGYYAGVQLFSNTNANDIRVLDDLTVPQPFAASAIHLSDNISYTNGVAYAIRLISDPAIGMAEMDELTGVTVYPNPSEGLVNISATKADKHTVEVFNVLGERVASEQFMLNTKLDLSGLAKGAYSVRVSNATASTVQPVVLN